MSSTYHRYEPKICIINCFVSFRIIVCSICTLAICGCAGSPLAVSKLAPEELKAVSDQQLCAAFAAYKEGSLRKDVPDVVAEVKRRRADCSEEVDLRRNDCSELQVVSTNPDPKFANVTTIKVRNNSTKAKRFLVHDPNGIYGRTQRLAPKSSMMINFAVDSNTKQAATLSTLVAPGLNAAGKRASWGLLDCYTDK